VSPHNHKTKFAPPARHIHPLLMSNRERVIELVRRLPADMSLEQIAREIELLAGIKSGREQAQRGEGSSIEDARKLVNTWVAP
jgi:hypothetical protein